LYLWTVNEVAFNIYKTARHYSSENYKLDSQVIIEMAKESSAKVGKVLTDIVFIHSGYLEVILEAEKRTETEKENSK